jgi:hypothetical protein
LEGASVASPYVTLASEAAVDAYNVNLAPIVDAKVMPVYKEHMEEHVETAKVKAKEFYEETKPAAVEMWEKGKMEAKNLRLSVASMVQEGAKVTREKYKSETPGEGVDGVLNVMEVRIEEKLYPRGPHPPLQLLVPILTQRSSRLAARR